MQTLPSGIEAKTGYLPNLEGKGMRHYVELGPSPEVPMAEAVEELRRVFAHPRLVDDVVFQRFRRYLKTYRAQESFRHQGEVHYKLFSILKGAPQEHIRMDYDEPGPEISVLGQQLSRNDVIGLTHYLMSNTTVEGSDDPRAVFIAELKESED